jgi:hypothetical protein
MPKTPFAEHLSMVDAGQVSPWKRLEYRTVRSENGTGYRLNAVETTGISIDPITTQQTKELQMKVSELTAAFANLPIDEKAEFISGLSAAIGNPKATPSPVDNVFAGADQRNVRAFAGILAQARRYGIEPAKDRKLATWEVDKALRECGREMSPESRIELKTRLAAAGLME